LKAQISRIELISVLAGCLFASTQVNAATINFTPSTSGFAVESYIEVAGSPIPGGTISGGNIIGEAGFERIRLDVDGINLDITIADLLDGNPYFDGPSGGKPAGLGSCRVLTGSAQCNPNSDDNLTIVENESLIMMFSNDADTSVQAVFGDFVFRDDNHNLIDGFVQVSHEGGSSVIAVNTGIADFSIIDASNFLLFNDEAGASTNYYITSAQLNVVPIPASVWLFGSGLGLLLGWTRRNRSAMAKV